MIIICRNEQNVLLNIFVKCWFITKTTAKVIIVSDFDLRIFSVYGLGARRVGVRTCIVC